MNVTPRDEVIKNVSVAVARAKRVDFQGFLVKRNGFYAKAPHELKRAVGLLIGGAMKVRIYPNENELDFFESFEKLKKIRSYFESDENTNETIGGLAESGAIPGELLVETTRSNLADSKLINGGN